MGKGGGCTPSKHKAPTGASDQDPPGPEKSYRSTRSFRFSGHSQTVSATPVQDGVEQSAKKLKIFLVFYSMYGHVELLAKRMKKGVDSVEGVEGVLYRVPETLASGVLEHMRVPQKSNEVPIISVEELVEADGLLFGFPTRYGSMPAQMTAFFESTWGLWEQQKLAGVPAGLFVSSGTQGGGQETTAVQSPFPSILDSMFSLLYSNSQSYGAHNLSKFSEYTRRVKNSDPVEVSMGKGGGCTPSKHKAPTGASDQDPPGPEKSYRSTRSFRFSGHSQTVSATPVQDGVEQSAKKLKIFLVFYSMYGHVELLAKRMKKGVDSVEGVEGVLYRVPETLASGVLEHMRVPQKSNEVPIISVEELVEADGLLFGFPTRYGSMPAQMTAFFESTWGLWEQQKLAGVPAGLFVSSGTQGGGQETTAINIVIMLVISCEKDSLSIVFLVKTDFRLSSQRNAYQFSVKVQGVRGINIQGFKILKLEKLNYSWTAITQLAHHGMLYVPIGYTFGAGMFKLDSLRGGSPYGAGAFSGDGTREPSETEFAVAEHQGRYHVSIDFDN
ncbi:NAD(P)H dehydrogenase (quinone) [Morella rubra]|uniref:NAD(P)H dehydrogenase (quinone) n=1 Tax=Morella rubra TaxID=262757 RepID=A0A6A1UFP4_9ROSI|nr:NAD(P)H dehydrogenase (quinone) [Morella rubra]KAB1207234.1 NAD(P)H dehydrogenase (quinone) [Morella rubra]